MRIAILFALVWPLAAQPQLTVGAIGGVNLTPDVNSGQQTLPSYTLPDGQVNNSTYIVTAPPRRPIIGLKLDFEFTRRWSIEVDALRREVRSTQTTILSPALIFPNGTQFDRFGPFTRTLTPWEFPVLAKYRLQTRFHPFLVGGPSFRPAGNGSGLSHAGVTAGAGVELRTPGGFRIEPQVRYTHWPDDQNGFNLGNPNRNQVEFLVGFDRRSPSGAPVSVFGQPLRVGFIAGIGLGTDFRVGQFNRAQRPERNSGIYGVVLEVPLTREWSVEADGLYRPLHGSEPEFGRSVRFAHLTWEFPVLAKYRIPLTSRLRPFFEGGPSFRAEGNLNLRNASHYGATFGGGVETSFHRLRVAPTYRYTRWSGGDESGAVSQTHRNQHQLLVSFTF